MAAAAAVVAAAVIVAAWVVPTFFGSSFVSVQVALRPEAAAANGERALVLSAGALAPSRRATIELTITNHYPVPVDLGFRGNAFRVQVVRVGERGAGGTVAWQTSLDDRVLEQQVDSPGPAGSERVVRLAPGTRTRSIGTVDLGATAALEATGTYRLTAWGYGIAAKPVSFGVVVATAGAPSAVDPQPSFPIRAAFYYPWFPEAWKQQGMDLFTKYHPALGFYDSSATATIKAHLAAFRYAGIQVGIASWWGQGSQTDARFPRLLAASAGTPIRWTVYYEPEGQSDPSVSRIRADLAYIRDRYGSDPSFLRVHGRFVVFVYSDAADGCGMVQRWTQANAGIGAYLVLKVFAGYAGCAEQPDAWHQYAPAHAEEQVPGSSFSISPGFFKATETAPRLARDPARWAANVRDMIASGAPWQLVTTFSEWGEGTAVEDAAEWQTASGYGAYLDALHRNGAAPGT